LTLLWTSETMALHCKPFWSKCQ